MKKQKVRKEYVARYTKSPELDVERNWSSNWEANFIYRDYESGMTWYHPAVYDEDEMSQVVKKFKHWWVWVKKGSDDESSVRQYENRHGTIKFPLEYRWHNGVEKYCMVRYDGLGAFQLKSKTAEMAVAEAQKLHENKQLDILRAANNGKGDGFFYADKVISYYPTKIPELWVFELNNNR